MPGNFPSSTPSFSGFTPSHTLSQDNHASQHNLEQAEIVNLATKIGTGSSTPVNQRLLRGTGSGTSSWAQADLTTDVTGVLPQANGGTGTTLATGTGKTVYDTAPTVSNPTFTGGGSWAGSPTIVTPTIASFLNGNHNHQNSAGGGQLDFGALLSTIFSGQVQTQANAGTAGGTLWWINLGGLKILWGLSILKANSTGGVQYTFTLPSFFTTVQTGFPAITNLDTNGGQFAAMETLTTSSVAVDITAITGTPNAKIGILIIGT